MLMELEATLEKAREERRRADLQRQVGYDKRNLANRSLKVVSSAANEDCATFSTISCILSSFAAWKTYTHRSHFICLPS